MDSLSFPAAARGTLHCVDAAAVLVAVPGAVLSHEEAARHLGIELAADSGARTITVPRDRSRVWVPGWRVVRRPVPEPLVLPNGLRVTPPWRTLADLAVLLPLDHAVAAADSALRKRLVAGADLVPLGRARGPGASACRRVHALLDPAAGSVLESLLRVLLHEAGLPSPRTQLLVVDGRHEVARVDFAWPQHRLVVEADGYAYHRDRAQYRHDRRRMNELERLGWRVLRFSWEDVVGRPGYVVGLVRHCLVVSG